MDAQPASLTACVRPNDDVPPVELLDRVEVEAMLRWLMWRRHELEGMLRGRYGRTLNAADFEDAFEVVALGLARAAAKPSNKVHAVWRAYEAGDTKAIERYVTRSMVNACNSIAKRHRGEVVMPPTGDGRSRGLTDHIDSQQRTGVHGPDVAGLGLGDQAIEETVRCLESEFLQHLASLPHFDEVWIVVFRLHRARKTMRQIAAEVGRRDVRRQVTTVDRHWRAWARRQGFVAPGAKR